MRKPFVLSLLLVALGSCVFPTDTCACTLVPPSAIVFGTVSRASGPAGVADVEITAYRPSCGDAIFDIRVLQTNTAGSYRGEIFGINAGETLCLRVFARALGGGPADTAAAVGSRVRVSTAVLPDSVRVDLQLPALP